MSTKSAPTSHVRSAGSTSPRSLVAWFLLSLWCWPPPVSAKERAAQPALPDRTPASSDEAVLRRPKPRVPAPSPGDSLSLARTMPPDRQWFAHESTPCRDSSLEALRQRVLDALFLKDKNLFAPSIDSGTAIEFDRLDEPYCETRRRFPPRFQLHCSETSDSLAHFLSPRFRVRARRTEAGWVLDRTLACVPGDIQRILQELSRRAEAHDTAFLNPLFGKNLTGMNLFQMAGAILHSGIGTDPFRMCRIDGDDAIHLVWPMCDLERHWDHKPQFDFLRSDGRWKLATIWQEDGCR